VSIVLLSVVTLPVPSSASLRARCTNVSATVSRYNPAQSNILASAASDRSIALYDTRLQTPVRKIVLQMASNGHNLPRLVR
jgi:hypothetical protein